MWPLLLADVIVDHLPLLTDSACSCWSEKTQLLPGPGRDAGLLRALCLLPASTSRLLCHLFFFFFLVRGRVLTAQCKITSHHCPATLFTFSTASKGAHMLTYVTIYCWFVYWHFAFPKRVPKLSIGKGLASLKVLSVLQCIKHLAPFHICTARKWVINLVGLGGCFLWESSGIFRNIV